VLTVRSAVIITDSTTESRTTK